jgi:transposase-like protein
MILPAGEIKGLPHRLTWYAPFQVDKQKNKKLAARKGAFLSFKHKYTYDEKAKILMEYQAGIHGFRKLCRIYGIAQQSLKDWIRLYETFGMEGLKTGSSATYYSK